MRKEERKPAWIRVRLGPDSGVAATRERLRTYGLHTVCEAAACPNAGTCWACGRATVLILGDRCTRGCRFCNVDKRPVAAPDPGEPARVAEAVRDSGLREVVVTSVTRDDLPDGGASLWAETVRRIRERAPGVLLEVLVPDFQGDAAALDTVLATRPDVFGHNLETVPRLYRQARPGSDYAWSLQLLKEFKARHPEVLTKSGLMVGLGETDDEILEVLHDLRAHDVDMLTIGQYLQPSAGHLPVLRYVHPDVFKMYETEALKMGFRNAACGPMVRSSYWADQQAHGAGVA